MPNVAPAVLSGTAISEAYRLACRYDVLAFKPGNVSIRAPGHRMEARQFLRSAAVSAAAIAEQEHGVGAAIYKAIAATQVAVGCNTNLGIVLLAVPLAHAAMRPGRTTLRNEVQEILAGTTRDDAVQVFAAIRLANPAGLGRAEAEDVATEPTSTLTEIMRLAAARDSIAAQYAYNFSTIFDEGLRHFSALGRGRISQAMVRCFLYFLSLRRDSHLERKHGLEIAEQVRAQAALVTAEFEACEDAARRATLLRTFDHELKARGLNPGTSADLTVASLLAWRLDALMQGRSAHPRGCGGD